MDEKSWKLIHECVLEAGSALSKEELCRLFMCNALKIIPCDSGAGIFDRQLRCTLASCWDETTIDNYNNHFRFSLPFISYDSNNQAREGKDLVYWGKYQESEFMRDFGRKLDLSYGLSPFRPVLPLNISLQRSKIGPEFSERDCLVLDCLNQHLDNLLTVADRLGRAYKTQWSVDLVRQVFPELSRREAELLSLCFEALTMGQIASALAISRRTAETHMANIFEKLGVNTRQAALHKLRFRFGDLASGS